MLQKFDKMKFLRYHDNVLVMQKNLVYNLFVICLSREQPEPFTPYSQNTDIDNYFVHYILIGSKLMLGNVRNVTINFC